MYFERRLFRWNWFVVFVHTSSFIALLTLTLVFNDTTRMVPIEGPPSTLTGSYPLAATLLPFPLITAIFHVMAANGLFNYYADVLGEGRNALRWVEYSITNGLMSWSLLFVAGDGAPLLLAITNVLSNFVMQYFGYRHEKTRSLTDLLLGFIPWAFNWSCVFVYWGARASTSSFTDGLALVGSFVWSIAFTLPLFYWLWTRKTRENIVRVNYNVERAYILLSLSAKLWLDWVITGAGLP